MTTTLVCLHGWGGSKESFTELREALKETNITVLTPDFPGFGTEPEPEKPWTNDDYADWIITWIKNKIPNTNNQKWFLLGHSHGGRIAIKLVTQKLTAHSLQLTAPSHLFLCAAAGIRHPRHIKRIIGLTLAKTGKFFLSIPGMNNLRPIGKTLLYKLVRVHDYEKATPVMRQTMINVAAEDLTPLLSKISVPTDLFWGTEDGMTPFSDANVMKREIHGSILHAYEGVRHGVHRVKAREIAEIIKKHLAENRK